MITRKQAQTLQVRTTRKHKNNGIFKKKNIPGAKLKFFSREHGEVEGELIKLNHRTVILEVKNKDKTKRVKKTLQGVSL